MGSCCVAEETSSSTQQTYKILFLGSGGCGKSTLFKQLKIMNGEGFTHKEKKAALSDIGCFVIETMQNLLDDDLFNIDEFKENEKMMGAIEEIRRIHVNANTTLNDEIAENVKLIWNEQRIKDIFEETAKNNLNGPCAYFFDSIDDICSPQFEPSDKDILMLRRTTTGLIEEWIAKTEYENIKFQMVDVGGQKNERKKWIHQFQNVSAICYVVSLSAFDEMLLEDAETNSLHDAIELFQEIMNSDSHWFKESSLFFIMNKKDLFKEKILKKSLKCCFNEEEYDENEYFNNIEDEQEKIEKNMQFIKNKFLLENKSDKEAITFVTCAYEEQQVQKVFTDILKHIVDKDKPDQEDTENGP